MHSVNIVVVIGFILLQAISIKSKVIVQRGFIKKGRNPRQDLKDTTINPANVEGQNQQEEKGIIKKKIKLIRKKNLISRAKKWQNQSRNRRKQARKRTTLKPNTVVAKARKRKKSSGKSKKLTNLRRNGHNFIENNPESKKRKQGFNNEAETNTQGKPVNKLLSYVLNIENKLRQKSTKEQTESKVNITSIDNEQTTTLSQKTALAEQEKQKEKKKKNLRKLKKKSERKKNKKIKKCNYFRQKLKDKTLSTCNRAKERAKLSYFSMDLLFEQVDSESKIYRKVSRREQMYSMFWKATTDFVSKNEKCSSNLNWNSILLKEKLEEFSQVIGELDLCFLDGQRTRLSNGTFNPNSLALTSKQQKGLSTCIKSQELLEKCPNCNKKCGKAMKNGN